MALEDWMTMYCVHTCMEDGTSKEAFTCGWTAAVPAMFDIDVGSPLSPQA